MNSAQYYELIRELKAINTKLDTLVEACKPAVFKSIGPDDFSDPLPPAKMHPTRVQLLSSMDHNRWVGGVPTSGPIGEEQELPFLDAQKDGGR